MDIPRGLHPYCTACQEFVDDYCRDHPGEWSLEFRRPSRRRNPRGGRPSHNQPPKSSGARHCEATIIEEGRSRICGKTTREGKSYCSDHVEEGSYIQGLMDRISGKDYEEDLAETSYARFRDHVGDEYTTTMDEIKLCLTLHGPRSIARIAKDIGINKDAAKSYIALLSHRGDVSITINTRGASIVRLLRDNPVVRKNSNNFIFSGSRRSRKRLLNVLYNLGKQQKLNVIFEQASYLISYYGYENTRHEDNVYKVTLDRIIKFTPEQLIDFIQRVGG